MRRIIASPFRWGHYPSILQRCFGGFIFCCLHTRSCQLKRAGNIPLHFFSKHSLLPPIPKKEKNLKKGQYPNFENETALEQSWALGGRSLRRGVLLGEHTCHHGTHPALIQPVPHSRTSRSVAQVPWQPAPRQGHSTRRREVLKYGFPSSIQWEKSLQRKGPGIGTFNIPRQMWDVVQDIKEAQEESRSSLVLE